MTCLPRRHIITVTHNRRDILFGSSDPNWISIVSKNETEQINANRIIIGDTITASESEHLSESVSSLSLLDILQTRLSEVLADVSAISDAANLSDVLNSLALSDEHQLRE